MERGKKSERIRGHMLMNIKIICRTSKVKGGEQMRFFVSWVFFYIYNPGFEFTKTSRDIL